MRSGKHTYEVVVGNVGTVHSGNAKRPAESVYAKYVKQSKSGVGRAGNEDVTLMMDGEPTKEYWRPVCDTCGAPLGSDGVCGACEIDSEVNERDLTKEQVYDAQISPLMKQIMDICKEHKIAMLSSFAIPNREDPDLVCTSALLAEEYDPPQQFLDALNLIGKPRTPMTMITVRNGSGEITRMEALLP